MLKRALATVFSLAVCPLLEAANWPDRPTLRAVRAAAAPVIDGDLSDPAWQDAPEFTDFTQHDPDDGRPATMRTSVRIVYDDDAIYFGARMEDPGPPTALLVRRDTFVQGDFLSINIDPQLDRLSGNAFTVTPADVQIDSLLYNDIAEDGTWDGVWASSAKIVAGGWVAELRIPYSQLRFPDKPVHTWGLNITRRTARVNEWVRIVNTRKGETGFVSHFADVVGLEGIRRGKPLELVPYAVTRTDYRTRSDNPLAEKQDYRADGGLDLKYALTPSLTLTGTINPDFGQVEVDPAVVNLTDFETFYPEKRPFFTEGLNMFRFGDTPAPSHFNFFQPPSLFYTRRIGRAPQRAVDADAVLTPADTTIYGAAKLTGRTPGGWSIGILEALTSAEHGTYLVGETVSREHFEPLTNYFVSRVHKTIGDGSRIGGMLTAVNRSLSDELQGLRQSAFTAGVDGYTSFLGKSWILEGFAVGSRMSGSQAALLRTQRSSARYYQRPDAGHIELDPARTSLSGWGGRAMLSKATGIWRPNVQVQAYSPGFETNDVGFMQRTDIISTHALMQMVDQRPTRRFREKNGWFGVWQNQNFDGNTFERGAFADVFGTTSNYWFMRGSLFLSPGSFSDRLTRGGPLVRTGFSWSSDTTLESDNRKKFYFGLYGHFEGSEEESYARTTTLALNARPAPNLLLTLEPSFSRSRDVHAFVTSFDDAAATATYGRSYVFANLEQRSFELGTRADWTLTPRLSFQLYLQPFIAAGDYHDYHALAAARTRDYLPAAETSSGNSDFNFRSVRGSAVARWEFRPGSALYVVWNENRAQEIERGDFSVNRDLRAISTAPSHDVFLVKVSYWLPM